MTILTDQESRAGGAVMLETDDEGYLDFVEGLRSFHLQTVGGVMAPLVAPLLGSMDDLEGIVAAARQIPLVQFRDRLARSAQEMMYRAATEGYRRRQDDLMAQIARAKESGTGSVACELDSYPDYVRTADIHIQPGGYDEDPLAGYIYHRITDVFFVGRNNRGEVHQAMVNAATGHLATPPKRILDLGGSCGQSATALKIRFPEAEVHMVDIAEPMVRYAHKRAADMDLDVHFHQLAAEDLSTFKDASFDLVYALILFHELPVEVGRQVVKEVRRVLAPDGTFIVLDFRSGSREFDPDPLSRYLGWFDTTHNGEAFSRGFVGSDFETTLRESFADVEPDVDLRIPLGALQVRVARS